MKTQLSLLILSIQSKILTLISICFAFFLPISGILLMIGVLICIDTFTGIWKAKKMSINENYKVVKGIDLWQSMKLLFARAKEVKEDLNKIKK